MSAAEFFVRGLTFVLTTAIVVYVICRIIMGSSR